MNEFENAEIVKDKFGQQYHIGLKPNEIADKVILVGDPARAQLIAQNFEKITAECHNREYVTYTGIYNGFNLSVMGTGIGCDNTEIAVIELCQLKFPITIIRCGTCGALQKEIKIGDLIISSGALRLENTSTYFVEEGYPAFASHEIILALLKSVNDLNLPYHLGITATAPGFYGAQGRHIPGFPLKDENLIDRLTRQGIKNFEMETSTLLTLAGLRGFRAGAVCVVFAARKKNKFIQPKEKKQAEIKAINTVLKAFEILNKMDEQKGNNPFWLPQI